MTTTQHLVTPADCQLQFEVVPEWPQLPPGWSFVEATAVATDSRGRVHVFNRGERPVIVFDADGEVQSDWGQGQFVRPHGITIAPDDSIFLVDDADHTIRKFSPEGKLLMTLGVSGQPSDTGATSVDFRTIERAGPPFHYPCNLAIAPSGELFVSDGYGNARIHKFTADGELLLSWGEPGDGPGEFHIPHGIDVDANGIVYVADRENSRIQRFDSDGQFIDEWTDIARPCQVLVRGDRVYIAEVGYRAGMWPGTEPPTPDATGGRVSVMTTSGELLARWGGGESPCSPGDFYAPHDVAVDANGAVYIAEVTWSAGGRKGLVPADCPSLQKFVPA